jgi:hypothetical protein
MAVSGGIRPDGGSRDPDSNRGTPRFQLPQRATFSGRKSLQISGFQTKRPERRFPAICGRFGAELAERLVSWPIQHCRIEPHESMCSPPALGPGFRCTDPSELNPSFDTSELPRTSSKPWWEHVSRLPAVRADGPFPCASIGRQSASSSSDAARMLGSRRSGCSRIHRGRMSSDGQRRCRQHALG